MYQNNHDDHRYSDSRDADQYDTVGHGYTEERYTEERYSDAEYYSDEYHSVEYQSDQRYADEHYSDDHKSDEHKSDEHYTRVQHSDAHHARRSVNEYYDDVDDDVTVLLNEPVDEEFFNDTHYRDKSSIDGQYSDERYNEGRYNIEHFAEEHFNKEHFDEDLFSEDNRSSAHSDPEIYEYNREGAGILYAEDFIDAQRGGKNRFAAVVGKIGLGLGVTVLAIGFVALTMFASKPQLTPAEIVQMEGYKGTTKDRTLFFNLASLRDCSDINDCDGVVKATETSELVQTGSSLKTTQASKSANGNSNESTTHMEYREIPAVATSQEKRDSNLWKVKRQWSNVRETPDMRGAIVTSLEADRPVTIVNSVGEWYEITTGDTSSAPLGFIHSSLLERM